MSVCYYFLIWWEITDMPFTEENTILINNLFNLKG